MGGHSTFRAWLAVNNELHTSMTKDEQMSKGQRKRWVSIDRQACVQMIKAKAIMIAKEHSLCREAKDDLGRCPDRHISLRRQLKWDLLLRMHYLRVDIFNRLVSEKSWGKPFLESHSIAVERAMAEMRKWIRREMREGLSRMLAGDNDEMRRGVERILAGEDSDSDV